MLLSILSSLVRYLLQTSSLFICDSLVIVQWAAFFNGLLDRDKGGILGGDMGIGLIVEFHDCEV